MNLTFYLNLSVIYVKIPDIFLEGSNSIMCNCLKQKIFDLEYNKSNIYNIKNQKFSEF